MKKLYKFRLYPSDLIEKKMIFVLDSCRILYNMQLEYEKQIYFLDQRYANRTELNNLIPDWKIIEPNIRKVHSQVLQNVSDRLHKAFEGFFRRTKSGEKAGFPRFKNRDRCVSFSYVQSGFKLEGGKLKLSKVGEINICLHRDIKGKVKTLTIEKTRTNKWYACFSVEQAQPIEQKRKGACVGIDIGLNHFYADSEGNKICAPEYLRKSEQKVVLLQKHHSRKKKGSLNRAKLRLKIAKLHEKVANQRLDFLHKQARKLADNYAYVAVEQLHIENMVKNHCLAKSISDASWYKFLHILSYKVEETGGQIVRVNAKGTSQYCICGNKVEKSLAVRVHKCNKCGLRMDRDVMSAILIKAIAFDKHTVGTTGINACGDATSAHPEIVAQIASLKQEA